MRLALATTLTLVLVGCDQDYGTARAQKTDDFDQAPSNQVDILWVIDDSTSMKEEQAAVQAAGADFIAELDNADMDFHIGLITTDGDSTNAKASSLLGTPTFLTADCKEDGVTTDCTYGADFATLVTQGTGGSDMEKGLEVALNTVTPPHSETDNAGFVRDGALLMVIILSDENDCSDGGRLGDTTGEACYTQYDELTPVGDLAAALQDAKAGTGGVVLSGIIGPEAVDNCQFAVPGKRYADAIRMLGGVEADICLQDYAPIMQSLGLVATGILTNFQLSYKASYTPDDPATADIDEGKNNPTVEVTPPGGDPDEDGVLVKDDPTNGWSYLADYAQIQFNGEAVPERGAHVRVTYYPAGPAPTGTAASGS